MQHKECDEIHEIEKLKDAYNSLIDDYYILRNSRTYRIAEMEKKIVYRFHLAGILEFLLSIRSNGLREAIRQHKVQSSLKKNNIRAKLSENISDDFDSSKSVPSENDILKLHHYADISNDGCIAIESVTFFKYDGSTYYSGGAERYILDLYEICKEINIQCRVYQFAEYNWIRFYKDLEVIGLPARNNDVNHYTSALVREMSLLFSKESKSAALNIYSPFYILTHKEKVPTLGISHGISWDNNDNHFDNGNSFWSKNKDIIDAAFLCANMISVDTNTCNWFQTIDYSLGQKIRYIPNYVNTNEFYPRQDYQKQRGSIIIIYPRRLYAARGLYLVLEILDSVLSTYAEVEFHFVGKGFENDTAKVQKKIAKWKGRVKMYSLPPDQMPHVYRNADISLIPTLFSEGTSLSCLEALSSGNAVIATRIGGLTDLILNGYNGILIEPNAIALKQALTDLLSHPDKINKLKKNAVQTVTAFSKNKWANDWKDLILKSFNTENTQQYIPPKRCLIRLKSAKLLQKPDAVKLFKEYLISGYYVFVACPNNPYKLYSYKRLQFIDQNEELYFEPEKVINFKNRKSEYGN